MNDLTKKLLVLTGVESSWVGGADGRKVVRETGPTLVDPLEITNVVPMDGYTLIITSNKSQFSTRLFQDVIESSEDIIKVLERDFQISIASPLVSENKDALSEN